MQTTLFQVALGFLAVQQCSAAVTWKTVGCNGWTFQGKTMDEIWDNAMFMANQAQSQISSIPKFAVFSETDKRAGANAQFMFQVDFKKRTGLTSAGQRTMSEVNSMYSNVKLGLQGTLPNLDLRNAYLFCGGQGLVESIVPGKQESATSIWHAEVMNGDQKEYITFGFITAGANRPCTEVGAQYYTGKTFTATRFVNGERTTMDAIILCPDQWAARNYPVTATLDLGFKAVPYSDKDFTDPYPYAGEYNSISGTLLHEMVHIVARTTGDTAVQDYATGFKECAIEAEGSQIKALKNPDTYRVYAEMGMSPDTVWGMPHPQRTTRAPLPTATSAPA